MHSSSPAATARVVIRRTMFDSKKATSQLGVQEWFASERRGYTAQPRWGGNRRDEKVTRWLRCVLEAAPAACPGV